MNPKPTKIGLLSAWRRGWPGAALAVLLGWVFLIFPAGSGLRNLSYDLGFQFRSSVEVDEVAIVYMDERSHAELGQDRWQRWDRSMHAELILKLKQARAEVVAFDILFLATTNQPAADEKLIEAAAAHGKVATAGKMTPQLHEAEIIGWQLTTPFPGLTNVAAWGVVEVGEENGAVREHYRNAAFPEPTLAWKAAELAMGQSPGGRLLPRWMNYYGPPGWIEWMSYVDVLRAPVEDVRARFAGKVVFVGAIWDVGFTGGKGTDDFRTPFTRWTGRKSPGVEVNATACLNLLRGDWLTQLSPITEFILILVAGVGLGVGLGSRRVLPAAGWAVMGAGLVMAVSLWAMWGMLVWYPWSIVAAVQIPTALGWSILTQVVSLSREKRFLQQKLALATAGTSEGDEDGESNGGGTPGRLPATPPVPAANGSGLTPAEDDWPSIPDHTLVRRVGEGAYGEVWLARDIIGRFHAVKVVYRRTFTDAVPFEREFNGIQRFTPLSLSHPGFVHILHVGRNPDPEYIFYVMELGDDAETGQTIDPEAYTPRTMAGEIRRRKRLPVDDCLRFGIQLADALDHLHRHELIHRDIKPANLIFVEGMAKFADIGLVTKLASDTKGATYIGTRGYIPPEGPGTASADIFSLGKVIYEAAFGMSVENFPEIPTEFLEDPDERVLDLNQIILRACENDVRKRYSSAAELRDALKGLRNGADRGGGL